MEEWKTYTLAELSKGKGSYGIAASAVPFNPTFHTYLRITDINDDGTLNKSGLMSVDENNANEYLLEPNDIVFARTGNSTGRSYFYDGSDGELVYAGFLIKFSLDEKKVNPRILKYYTHSKPYYDWVKLFDTGGTRGNINAKTYGDMPIILPSRSNQDRIVEVLKSLDDKIEINRRINDNLEQQTQALFKSWFIDFEPFRDGVFVESELGMIPKGWRLIRFDSFITASSEKCGVGELPEYSVTNNGIIPRDSKFNKQLSKTTSKNKVLRENDLVFGMSREILNWGIMEDKIGGVSSAYNVYTINQDLVPPTYLRLYMSAKISYFNVLIGTAAREGQSLDKGALMKKVVYIPPIVVYTEFMKIFSALTKQKDEVNKESGLLVNLRDSLLPKLMSGELKIGEMNV